MKWGETEERKMKRAKVTVFKEILAKTTSASITLFQVSLYSYPPQCTGSGSNCVISKVQ